MRRGGEGESVSPVMEDEQSYTKYSVGLPSRDSISKVLGVQWDSETDQFCIDFSHIVELANSLPPTKRSLLKLAATIFDPLGCISLFTVNLKILFQKFCLEHLGWDEILQGDNRDRYDRVVSDIRKLKRVHIPRCLFEANKVVRSVQIHAFSDASEKAYATSVYLRVEYETNEVDVRFITAKAKVSPIKAQSIPRLELLGACLMAKLVDTIKCTLEAELDIGNIETFYWVDSTAALCWIKNVKVWKQYVRHRVDQILQTSSRDEWHFCPGTLNPANFPSRGRVGPSLSENNIWWEGPLFLKLPSQEWPKQDHNESSSQEAMREGVVNPPDTTHVILSKEKCSLTNVVQDMDLNRFSSKIKVVRVKAWIHRFVRNLKAAVKEEELNLDKTLSTEELEYAEERLIRSIQEDAFRREIDFIKSKSTLGRNTPSLVNQFGLFLDDKGILRCKSRLSNSSIEESAQTSILMPSKHRFSEMLIWSAHRQVFHNGIKDTLNVIRLNYWVLRGREQV